MDNEKFGPYFNRIKINNFYLILRYLDVFSRTECSFLNRKYKQIISTKYPKSTFMIKSSLKIYKAHIHIIFSQDFNNYLKNNSFKITKEIKQIIQNVVNDFYTRLPIMKYFFSRILLSNNVKYLNLKNNEIGKKSMKYLSFYMENKPKMDTLILSDNKLNAQVLEPLVGINTNRVDNNFDMIKMNRCLVDIMTCKILSKIKFAKLIMKNSSIENQIEFLKSERITHLNLKNNFISCEGVLHVCQNLPNLQVLNLANNNLTDISTVYLSLYIKKKECRLKNLNIKNNKITLAGFMTIISVLNDTQYSMQKINCSCNAIDNLPKRLPNYTHIDVKSLKIGGHNFTIDDLSYLLDFLNLNKSIEELDLSKIILDNVLLHFLFTKLQNNSQLHKLILNNCYLGNTEINDTLLSYYSNEDLVNKISSLGLKQNCYSLNNFNKILSTNSIVSLNLEGNDLNTREDLELFFEEIIRNHTIKELNLNKNYLKQKGKDFLMKLSDESCTSSLEILHLEDNGITELNIELTNLLSKNKRLKELYLDRNEINDELGNNYFFHSATNSNMKLLSLKENKIGLSFLSKYISYYKENQGSSVTINIHSKHLLDEYNKDEENKNKFLEISNYKNIIAL